MERKTVSVTSHACNLNSSDADQQVWKSFPQLGYCCINSRALLGDGKNLYETAILKMSKTRIASENTQNNLYGTSVLIVPRHMLLGF